jgi:DNA-binding response OmpR family regulator
MPKVDGWELLKRIKSEARNKDTPVIVLSVVKKRKNSLQADVYLVKPFDVKKLSQEVKNILGDKDV